MKGLPHGRFPALRERVPPANLLGVRPGRYHGAMGGLSLTVRRICGAFPGRPVALTRFPRGMSLSPGAEPKDYSAQPHPDRYMPSPLQTPALSRQRLPPNGPASP